MSKIANDDLTRSGTGCFIGPYTGMATVGVKGLRQENHKQLAKPARIVFTVARYLLCNINQRHSVSK